MADSMNAILAGSRVDGMTRVSSAGVVVERERE